MISGVCEPLDTNNSNCGSKKTVYLNKTVRCFDEGEISLIYHLQANMRLLILYMYNTYMHNTNSIRTVDCDYIFVKYKFLQSFFIASKLKHCNKQWLSCFFGCRKDLIGNCIMILESYNWLKSTTKSSSVVIKYGTETFKMW